MHWCDKNQNIARVRKAGEEGRRQSSMLGEPTEDGDCWLKDTALGEGFIKLQLSANILGVDIKKSIS